MFSRKPLDAAADLKSLKALDAQFARNPDKFIEQAKPPSAQDFALIGKLVQLYCFADFCARRIIDAVDEAAEGEKHRKAAHLKDHDVFVHLRRVAAKLKKENHRAMANRAADIMEMHRDNRHRLAHWAVRKTRDGKTFILLSKDARRASKEHGRIVGSRSVSYGFMTKKWLQREVKKLEDHTQNLSLMAALLEQNQNQLGGHLREKGLR